MISTLISRFPIQQLCFYLHHSKETLTLKEYVFEKTSQTNYKINNEVKCLQDAVVIENANIFNKIALDPDFLLLFEHESKNECFYPKNPLFLKFITTNLRQLRNEIFAKI